MLRPISIYLPQYHPIPENDQWWGKGFTEWTNVSRAKPLFKDHYQPHLPADLGFYDLRLEETRIQQAKLAREYGIHGFCYYHYWFNGKRLLERPVEEMFKSGKPDFPFLLCWANENWTRIWDGGFNDILMEQHYSEDDDRQHIKALIPYFKDSRYIKVDNKPVFVIYRCELLPNVKSTIQIWREEASKEGIELYLCNFEFYGNQTASNLFDSSIEFQPFSASLNRFLKERKDIKSQDQVIKDLWIRLIHKFSKQKAIRILNAFKNRVSYTDYVEYVINHYVYPKDYKRYPCVTPSWDNTARKKDRAFLFYDANPNDYKKWLNYHKQNFASPSPEENFIFINAWNEWAEGNHLEPCHKWGLQFLEATKEIFPPQHK